MVAVIDSLDEEEDDEDDIKAAPPQLRNMNPSSGVQRVLQLKIGGVPLTIKTTSGKGDIPVLSRNSPLANEGVRTVAEINMSDSLTTAGHQRNRLPPSLKTGTIDVTNSGSGGVGLTSDQSVAEGTTLHGSQETGKIAKKKIAFVTSKVSSDSQVNFNNPKHSTRESNHRAGKTLP